jgi:hypothetical protein
MYWWFKDAVLCSYHDTAYILAMPRSVLVRSFRREASVTSVTRGHDIYIAKYCRGDEVLIASSDESMDDSCMYYQYQYGSGR